jgi:hypothetical protein
MKQLFMAVCAAALLYLAPGCKKLQEHTVPNNSIQGVWELIQISWNYTINYNPGDSVLKFTDTDYEISKKGVVSKTGKYELVNDTTVNAETGLVMQPGAYTRRIIFDNRINDQKVFIEIADNKLRLASGYFPTDGGTLAAYGRILGL